MFTKLEVETCVETCNATYDEFLFQGLQINTMTMLVETNLNIIPMDTLKSKLSEEVLQMFGTGLKTKKTFSNCIIFSFTYESRFVAVKMFSNGKLHITGLHCYEHAEAVSLKHMELVKHVLEMGDEYSPKILNVSNHMINASFKLKKCIDLGNLSKLASTVKENIYSVLYEKTTHPGINIKIHDPDYQSKKITILVFSTGSIILTGMKNLDGLRCAFTTFMHLVDLFPQVLKPACFLIKEKKKRGRKPKKAKEDFYSSFVI